MQVRADVYELVRVLGRDDFHTVGTISDRDEATFLQRVLNERCEGRVYLLRPAQHPQRRAE